MTATIDGAPVTSAPPAVVVIPGDVSGAASEATVDRDRLDVGAKSRLELTTRDAAGNPILTGGLDVEFSVGDGTSGGTLSPTTDVADTITAILTARDAEGYELAGGGRAVELTASGGTSGVAVESAPALDADDGTYSSCPAGVTPGTPVTIGATIDGVAVTSPLPVLVLE